MPSPFFRPSPQGLGLLSAAIPSPYGDAVGLLADAAGYAEDPKSLTPLSGLLSVAGLIPGIPSGRLLKQVDRGAGKLFTHQIIANGQHVGHISGFAEDGAFHITRTEIPEKFKQFRGTGLYQDAVQELADSFPKGAYVFADEASPQLQKALKKIPSTVFGDLDGRNGFFIRPTK